MGYENEQRLFRSVEQAQAKRWEPEQCDDEEPVFCCEWCKTELPARPLSDLCRDCEIKDDPSLMEESA